MLDLLAKLNRTRLTIAAVILTVVGLAILMASGVIPSDSLPGWLGTNVLSNLGGGIFTTGLLSVTGSIVSGKLDEDRKKVEERQRKAETRAIFREEADVMRDAVIDGFAVKPEDLARVATPELLDTIATNALGLRLHDQTFAAEIYSNLRDQAIRAAERWHDVDVKIRLSGIPERSTAGAPRFIVTVTWSYTVTPSHSVQRFACVSDRDEFHELVSDIPATSTWFMTPRPGFDASQRDAFELVSYAVNGGSRTIRRTQRKTGQTYTVAIGEESVRASKPVEITYVYRTITPQAGHLLHFDIDQPTKGITVEFDYSDAPISHVSVLDLVGTAQKSRILRLPEAVPGQSVTVSVDGWIFPRAGFAFVWTLGAETATESRRTARST